ncbi:TIGR04348 family glycosyltransferase [Methylobacterium sp. WL103]|uniref:selenoneine biosynthesis selenosugar synthase SenB n=1 Tax=Methylobacterium sp. WL103 TaxID=2603891 RepID=UPI0011C99D2B|nr:selenoneine biosynthesis selenosugar synthase SenB [Methylobacterium sp. WL103]TXM97807.1 TIGR04348 family glycosyltransferase [Methylobacterium sp. WL103]
MNVILITPAPRHSRTGNRTTALRWAGFLRGAGHRVVVATAYDGEPCDLMIALHAWKSAPAIQRFRRAYPERPLVVALTGTDINHDLAADPATTQRSLDLADALVGLHELVGESIPARHREKLAVIVQSVPAGGDRLPALKRAFEILVVGHLRDEKDPLRAAIAARVLPASSRIRVVQLGGAPDPAWAARARDEMQANPRYDWRGEVSGARVRRFLRRGRLMVLSSLSEGGANVVSEAVVAGLPILASAIPGNVGLLGGDHPGYFPPGDHGALAGLMLRAEREPDFLEGLRAHGAARADAFDPARERLAWSALVERASAAARARVASGIDAARPAPALLQP